MMVGNREDLPETALTPALYVVATPIGNLADISQRALHVLGHVHLIAAEDTRHSKRLLSHYGIRTPLVATHEHNEAAMVAKLAGKIADGQAVALICDAGTPGISDPGALLIGQLRELGLEIRPVPGPCAAIAALSISGALSRNWLFEGFLPSRRSARRARLALLQGETRTLVLYEAPHRVRDTLLDIGEVMGEKRVIGLAKELTKIHETYLAGDANSLLQWLQADPARQKGEFVLLVAGLSDAEKRNDLPQLRECLEVLLQELPLKKAVTVAARLTGAPRNLVYQAALAIRNPGG